MSPTIDSHVHILPDSVRLDRASTAAADPWFQMCHPASARMASARQLLQQMDDNGIDRSICLGWPFASSALCRESNDYIAAAQRQHPERLIGFGIVQPADPGAALEVERCARLGLRGIGELNSDAQGFPLLGEAADAVAEACVRTGMVWTLHCSEPVGHRYPGKGTLTPDRLMPFLEVHDELQVIGAHLGGGLPFYAHMPEVARLCQRLWFDTAAQPYLYHASVYTTLVQMVGAERLLLGSDYPLLELPRYLRALRRAGLTEQQSASICGGNAVRLLGLT